MGFGLAAMTIFEISGRESPFSDHDSMRDTHELRIRELHPRPRVAIIQQHIDPGRIELLVQQVGRFLDTGRFLIIDGHQNDLKGRNGIRPDDAVGIVILFDRRGDHPRDADAVASHEHGQSLSLFVEHARFHRFAVQLSQLKNMADFDAAGDFQGSMTARAGVAVLGVAQIHRGWVGQVTAPIHPGEMHILFVGAADEVRQMSGGMIDIDFSPRSQWVR